MAQSKGNVNPNFPNHICRLQKAIYGLKQAPRAWYEDLKSHLTKIGFVKSKSDASLFIFPSEAVTIYILEILSDVDMADCKGVTTPMCSSLPPKAADGSSPADATLYRRTIGKLQYLSFTCPDIAFAVNKLSQFMQSPSLDHWKAVKRAGDPCDRISTSGYILFLGPNMICLSSKKQQSVARSSTEAKYKSVTNALSEVTWVHNLLTELR
ncbi:uncharacterized mitochondrial protein AtMg00810-like [Solanum tuberosum]|uniref:uncharacterized mitochondrial protein AtMg00810-like n=1 Tax=Solanum tuberosum TaxID=4113 RepID=UPI00073A4B21|nr:PREDICTED: uncharacterized mitochondrial protein AtMg00810-like [Solanum tuberosum]